MRLVSLLLLGAVLTLPNAMALETGGPGQVVVDGKTYTAPVESKDVKLLQKAIKGSQVARRKLLEDKNEKLVFVGDQNAMWVKVTKDQIKVYKPEAR